MNSLLNQPLESRRGFLKATGLASLATLAATGLTRSAAAEETAPLAKMTAATEADIAKLPRVRQALVDPPFLPEHAQKAGSQPRVVEATLPIVEKKIEIDDEGTEIWA